MGNTNKQTQKSYVEKVMLTAIPYGVIEEPDKTILKLSVFITPKLSIKGKPNIEPLSIPLKNFEHFSNWPPDEFLEETFKFKVSISDIGGYDGLPLNRPEKDLWKKIFTPDMPVESWDESTQLGISYTSINEPFKVDTIYNGIQELYKDTGKENPKNPPKKEWFNESLWNKLQKPTPEQVMDSDWPREFQNVYEFYKQPVKQQKSDRSNNNKPRIEFHKAIAILAEYPLLLRKLGLIYDIKIEMNHTSQFTIDSISQWESLLNSLKPNEEQDPILQRIWELLSEATIGEIEKWKNCKPDDKLKNSVIKDFNKILKIWDFYVPKTFKRLDNIDEEAKNYLKQGLNNLNEYETSRFNRLIFEAIFPKKISKSRKDFSGKFIFVKLNETINGLAVDSPGTKCKYIKKEKTSFFLPWQDVPVANFGFLSQFNDQQCEKPRFMGTSLDQESAVLRSILFKENIKNMKDQESDNKVGIPSLRTSGLSLAQIQGRILESKVSIGNSYEAINLNKGYRIDVLELDSNQKEKDWKSLHIREEIYKIYDKNGKLIYEIRGNDLEGSLSDTFNFQEKDNKDKYYLHQSIFHWDGWSLSADRIPSEKEILNGLWGEEKKNKNKLTVKFEVKEGSLPTLRFGRKYKFRIRLVDIAGNSCLYWPEKNNKGKMDFTRYESKPVEYLRYDPVAAPLTRRIVDDKEETVNELVILSHDIDDYKNDITKDSCEIIPPRTSWSMVEHHGMLDVNGKISLFQTGTVIKNVNGEDPPDPLFKTVAIKGLNNEEFPYLPIRDWFGINYPTGDPLNIEIKTSNTSPYEWDNEKRILTVHLEKSEIKTLSLSSCIDESKIDQLGVWQWLNNEHELPDDFDTIDAFKTFVAKGGHWMITPKRELKLIHAVQKPINDPKFAPKFLVATKTQNNTFALLKGKLYIHSNSSSRFDIEAEWDDIIPNKGSKDGYDKRHRTANLKGLDIERNNNAVDFSIKHEFGDTKYRKITYKPIAISRFKEYFKDINLTDTDFIKVGKEAIVDVKNSSRPAMPVVEYIIPTFKWREESLSNNSECKSTREGGWLRIYLKNDPPWFSSGEGELLGVVFYDSSGSGFTDEHKNFVSQFGRDPVWNNLKPFSSLLSESNLKNSKIVENKLTIEEAVETNAFAAAGFSVSWDSDRKMWYSDINIDLSSLYFPFVRLALARYQPNSLDNAHLSRIQLADFIQLTPERCVTLSRDQTELDKIRVTISGPSTGDMLGEDANPNGCSKSTAKVSLEVASPKSNGKWLYVNEWELDKSRDGNNESIWEKEITIQKSSQNNDYQLHIWEYERWKRDTPRDSIWEGNTGDYTNRLVYYHIVKVPM